MKAKISNDNTRVKFKDSIEAIGIQAWNGLAGKSYPFLRYEFLHALEASGSVSAETGWDPRHLCIYHEDELAAIMPLYMKDHSYGEYVFDWAWADAYQRHGFNYYPKLVTAIPYTPSTGPRLCIAEKFKQHIDLSLLATQIRQFAASNNCSSWHVLFPDQALIDQHQQSQLSLRQGCQFHWFNQDYRDFDDFLSGFVSRKRKKLKRERRRVAEQEISLRRIVGTEITAKDIDIFYDFYQATYLKRGRHGYLNHAFFVSLRETMPEQLMLVMAERHGHPVGAALCFVGDDTLYGRYWGCIEEFECLHFEACFYQGIEYCIEQGLARFDPGAQGEHKILRGFTPIDTWSLHWIEQKAFREAIDDFLLREQRGMDHYRADAETLLPFKQSADL